MPLVLHRSLYFGSFLVNPQVFYVTKLSFALVNLKPLLPGHVLVSPIRVVPRVAELTSDEVTDLFQTVQCVGRMVERVFKASALNIAIQDGVAAGQSVAHVHTHIIPRVIGDMDSRGGGDAIYSEMQSEKGNLSRHFSEHGSFTRLDVDDGRKPRSSDEMSKEAEWLAAEMQKEIGQ